MVDIAGLERHRYDSFFLRYDDEKKHFASSGFYSGAILDKCWVCDSLCPDHNLSCWFLRLIKFRERLGLGPSPFERYDHLKFEANRVRTFIDWPRRSLSPFTMARAGFYYTRHLDFVRCIFCGIVIGDWSDEDDQYERHSAGYCPFLNGEPVGNVSIGVSSLLEEKRKDAAVHQQPRVWQSPHVSTEAAQIFSHLQSYDVRLASFRGWTSKCNVNHAWSYFNESSLPPLTRLALWGFAYTGIGDHVVCYACGLKMYGWNYDDNVMEIHRYYSPQCPHMLTQSFTFSSVPKPPPLEEERKRMTNTRFFYDFDDDEIQYMMQNLDILKYAVEGCRQKYEVVKRVFEKKVKETAMLFNSIDECLKEVEKENFPI